MFCTVLGCSKDQQILNTNGSDSSEAGMSYLSLGHDGAGTPLINLCSFLLFQATSLSYHRREAVRKKLPKKTFQRESELSNVAMVAKKTST